MTAEQYWNDDPWLVKFYRQAEELRQDRANQDAWLQGMYIYDAIMRLSPILHPFAKKGTKPMPYVENPYPISEARAEEIKQKKEKAIADKGKRFMEAFMAKYNKQYEGKEE